MHHELTLEEKIRGRKVLYVFFGSDRLVFIWVFLSTSVVSSNNNCGVFGCFSECQWRITPSTSPTL